MSTPSKRKSMKAARRPGKASARSGVLAFRSSNVRLEAAAAAGGTRSFSGCAYTGGIFYPQIILGRETISGPSVLDLDSIKIPSQVRPVLDEHDESTDGKIGQTDSIRIVGYQMNVAGFLFSEKDRAKKILSASDAGGVWQLSIGMDGFRIERVPAGRAVFVNGQQLVGPFALIRNAYLTEISFVSVGGDDTTWVNVAAARRVTRSKARASAGKSAKGVAMSFEEWMKQNFPSIDLTKVDQTELANYRTQFAASQSKGDDDEDLEDDEDDEEEDDELTEAEQAAALAAARKRKKLRASRGGAPVRGGDGASMDRVVDRATRAAIRATRAEAARVAHINALAGDNKAEAEQAIANGTDAKDFELAMLRAGRSRHSGAPMPLETDDEPQVMEAALLINNSFNQDRLKDFFPESVLNRAMSSRYRGFSLVECGDRLIRRAGVQYDGTRGQTSHMTAVRDACAKLTASGFTSMTLSSILENAADKVLLDAYQAVETVWQRFCAVRSLSDFKTHSQYALDPLSVFQAVGPQGDFANLQFGDRKYSLQAGSYGVRFKIDFQTWKNDDLGSINDRIGVIGQLGASTIEQVVHALLMAGIGNTALFHSSNANYDATSSSTFGIAGLTFAETMWANQVRQNGTPLGISPQTLLVGTALKTAASQVFTSAKLNEVFTTAQTRTGPVAQDNPYAGKYQPVVDPYLNNTLLKNNTGAKAAAIPHQDNALWMLLARQGNNAPLNVGFLDGQQSPRVEIIQNQSEMVGFELAAGLHFGVGYGDPKLASCFNPAAA